MVPLPILLAVCALLAVSLPPHALAQSESPDAIPQHSTAFVIESPLTAELVQARISKLEADTSIAEEVRAGLLEQYRDVLGNLEQIKAFNARALESRSALERAPSEAEAIRDQLRTDREQLSTESGQEPPPATDLKETERLLARQKAELASIDAMLAEINKALDESDLQPTLIRTRLAEARNALESISAELKLPLGETLGTEAREARQWALESRRDALRAEILALDQQLLSADARRELTQARRDQLQHTQKRLREHRAFLENEADRLRRVEAERVRSETAAAERETLGAHPLVRTLAEQNRDLSDAIGDITRDLDQIDEQQAALEERTLALEQNFRSARERLEAVGLSRALGQALLDERNQLPEPRTLRRQSEQRAERIGEITLAEIRHRDELRQLGEMGRYLAEATAGVEPEQQEQVQAALRKQAELRATLLQRAIDIETSYRRALTALDLAAAQLRETTERYDAFLSERLLWVRSTPPLTEQNFASLPAALRWLLSPTNWLQTGQSLLDGAWRSPLFWLGLLGVAALLWFGGAMRKGIRSRADGLRRISTDRFGLTLEALALTLLLALPWPLLALLLGLQLQAAPQADAFAQAVSNAALSLVPALYYLRAFQLICMPGGLADRHFRWRSEGLTLLRRAIGVAMTLLLPLGFIAAAVYGSADEGFRGTLGRLALTLIGLGLAVLTARVMHPRRGILSAVLEAGPNGWLNRLRLLWYPLMVGVPAALSIMALSGYLYTSGTLLALFIGELWLVLALIVLHQLIARWLIVTRRSLALKAALERRAAREAEREAAADKPAETALSAEEEAVDLATLDAQTRKLLNTVIGLAAALGLFLIWSDVLPALSLLERVTLWSYSTRVDGVERTVPVTLASIGLVLVILLVATVAARNLPALLEILLLKNTAVSAGSRYAATTLTGYGITAIGALLVFSTLGLSWGQVQWLVAALGVGIGFGLQEIVANFISGLIILFERPVRVGDIVTIGDTSGVVTKIEIRATTIRNWDKQELLVPNKEFITGRLLNWTLTDQTNRVTITVGVEYGSDVAAALGLLAEAARENARVMTDPAPMVTMEGFGDNALTLVLRCYLENLDYRLTVTSELHQAIDSKFRAAGIGIAYPQRDIHLRSAEPLEVRFSRAPVSARSTAEQPRA
ncbi:mechanosensitive ion channel domain-containing protein [Thiohalocapsa marina]|uniref:mechanosensitive ion channel domain-containing protein n=1 Tax=Thiohalocapsa marina TaxID=424902 RepID=UPI0014797240|nr:mechanosensitive ion channel domain-containing protein [Thiohalocapsa marina]